MCLILISKWRTTQQMIIWGGRKKNKRIKKKLVVQRIKAKCHGVPSSCTLEVPFAMWHKGMSEVHECWVARPALLALGIDNPSCAPVNAPKQFPLESGQTRVCWIISLVESILGWKAWRGSSTWCWKSRWRCYFSPWNSFKRKRIPCIKRACITKKQHIINPYTKIGYNHQPR